MRERSASRYLGDKVFGSAALFAEKLCFSGASHIFSRLRRGLHDAPGGIAARNKGVPSEKRSFSANKAAEPHRLTAYSLPIEIMIKSKNFLFVIVLLSGSIFAQSGGSYVIERSVIASGGGKSSGAGIFEVEGTIGQPVAGLSAPVGSFRLISGFWGGSIATAPRRTPFDFDGDNKTDISIFRPGPAEWWILRSSDGGNFATQFGAPTDTITPGDFTGDGKTDIAFWRPSTGFWFVLRSEDLSFYSFPFGTTGDIPAPADFDGNGTTDAGVFRPSTATWYMQRPFGFAITAFGANGDRPIPADYDGDGKADVAIYRPNVAEWWILRSALGLVAVQFGVSGDKALPGDFTGDGRADVAFWRPSNGFWFVLRSDDFSFYSFPFGATSDLPVQGDYDGDGKSDAAVFRPSTTTWFVNRSSGGTTIVGFGAPTDAPLPGAFVR